MIGGGMSYTFFKAMGFEIGTSILDEESLDLARDIMKKAEDAGVEFLLPVDTVCAKEFNNDSPQIVCDRDKIPADMMGMDIGPKTWSFIRRNWQKPKPSYGMVRRAYLKCRISRQGQKRSHRLWQTAMP